MGIGKGTGSIEIMVPKVSIVTVVRNGFEWIARTMESVQRQDFNDYEYLVWDGASTDGTADEARRIACRGTRVISSTDSGPYDAMNKAILECQGEWIIYMNCGDVFADLAALGDLAREFVDDADIVYGGCIKVFPFGERVQQAGLVRELWSSTIFWHQSVAVKRALQVKHPFDTSLQVSADYAFFWKMHCCGRKFRRLDRIISRVAVGGISDKNELRGIRERYFAVKDDIPLKGWGNYLLSVASYHLRRGLKIALPSKLVEWIKLHRKVRA